MTQVTCIEALPYIEAMGYVAHTHSLSPSERLNRLNTAADLAAEHLDAVGQPTSGGDYISSIRLRAWLACLPSLQAKALGIPHNADISEQVLGNLQPALHQLLIDSTESIHSFRGKPGLVDGLIGELSVLGTVLWSHATDPRRVRRSIIPATPSQDASRPGNIRRGFDLLLDTQKAFVPIQVKNSDKDTIDKMMRGYETEIYQKAIVVLYVSRILRESDNPTFASHLLANAVVREDEDTLTMANERIDERVSRAKLQIVDASELYS